MQDSAGVTVRCLYDELVPVAELKPHPQNRNVHPEDQIDRLAKIIEFQGWRYPIKVSKRSGFITAGHGRLMAAVRKGWPVVPVNYQDYDSEEMEYLDVQADNAIASWAELDLSGIHKDLEQLGPFDLDLLGINGFEFEPTQVPGAEDDEVPAVPAEPKTRRGDVYQLGPHRLICGDSTMIDDIDKLMAGQHADMVFTDPPYNVDYDPESRASHFSPERKARPLGKIENDKKSPEDFRRFLDDVYSSANCSLRPGGAIYICHADTEGHHFRNAFIAQPWKLQSCLIWKKTVLVFGRADYHWIHEPILYGWKEGAAHEWLGDRKQTTVIEISTDHYNRKQSDTDGYVHPTQKPVALIEQAIANSCPKGGLVLDLFGGSGSTLIAAEKAQRRAALCELDPKYCDVIVARWEKYTGKQAELVNG
jgi:DNA modification methylase